MTRQLEPFSYFVEHASAIDGFGGDEQGPDPRYCFHTHYEQLPPGRVNYHMRMLGARASEGELTLRVHAYKPGSESGPSLVNGSKQRLDGLGKNGPGAEIDVEVSFAAVDGVHYALYGYFSEPSDLCVDDVIITIDELGPEISEPEPDIARGRSRFEITGIEMPVRLHTDATPSLTEPVSQDCTLRQLAALNIADPAAALARWRSDIPLAALTRYGMFREGAAGIILGAAPDGLHDALAARGCSIVDAAADPATFADFAISYALIETVTQPGERFQLLQRTLGRLLHGGLAIFVFDYRAGESPDPARPSFCDRNEIKQWVLRLIGFGHDVVQLTFADAGQRMTLADGTTPFVLIVRARAR